MYMCVYMYVCIYIYIYIYICQQAAPDEETIARQASGEAERAHYYCYYYQHYDYYDY